MSFGKSWGPGRGHLLSALAILVAVMVTGLVCVGETTVTYVNAQDIWGLDPRVDTQGTSDGLFTNVFDPLWRVAFDPVRAEPALAVSWEYTDDVTLVVHLRQNVAWHDGQPFTADDVVATFKHLNDPKVSRYTWLKKVNLAHENNVEKVDDHTVIFHFSAPFAPGPLGFATFFIQPAHIDPVQYANAAIGTGAYKLVEWRPKESIKLVANESWWGWGALAPREGRPDVVYYRPVPEDYSRYAMLASGEADIAGGLLPERVPEIQASKTMRIETIASLRNFYIGMNAWKPPFDDVRVRRALSYAIDWQAIVTNLLNGMGTTHAGFCGPSEYGYCADCYTYDYHYDPALCKQLLAEAGYPNGFKVTFSSPNGKYTKDLEISQAIVGFLQDVGLEVEIQAPAWTEYWSAYTNVQMEIFLLSYGGIYPDCGDRASGRLEKGAGGLYFNDPYSDQLFQQQRSTMDPEKRSAIWKDLNVFLNEQAPFISGFDGNFIFGVQERIDWHPIPLEYVILWNVVVKK